MRSVTARTMPINLSSQGFVVVRTYEAHHDLGFVEQENSWDAVYLERLRDFRMAIDIDTHDH